MQRLAITPAQICGSSLTLTAEQAHYLRRVLRLQVGDRFIALDGQGQAWQAELTAAGATLGAAIACDTELPITITLLVALPKGNGFDDIVRSGTELGAAAFFPVLAMRSLLQPSAQKLARWQRIAREAAEQSERVVVPQIATPLPLAAAIAQLAPDSRRYVCTARGERIHLARALSSISAGSAGVAIATGPEGGWTLDELALLQQADFTAVSLGRRVLRAITAPLAALALLAAAVEVPTALNQPASTQAES
ncbi:MAG: 16S rRNA (uracil(1498)-N(3))-methyltransferase [Spirulinaceae cyanobacterium SM2_1_0]|nr:16S rRNA (uracil(1498)-N(3))-methyltransferase [Spirulinaceae cyanobacterium SM2_1_0]